MERGHRVLGRTVGLAFVLPLAYFTTVGGSQVPCASRS